MNGCVLCSLVRGDLPAGLVYQDELVVALMAPTPANPGHLWLTPRLHTERLSDLSEETGMHMFRTAMRLVRAIRNAGIKCEGAYLGLVEGEGAFQIVPHVYMDLVPRFRWDRYWTLSVIDRPYAQPDALQRALFDQRPGRLFDEAMRKRDIESSPEKIDEYAARIRQSYLAIWGAN